MMVGPSGSGKSSAWRVLLKALERYEGVEGVAHVIDLGYKNAALKSLCLDPEHLYPKKQDVSHTSINMANTIYLLVLISWCSSHRLH